MTNYISRAEAEELCDELIRQFTGSTSSDPNPVDIDLFVRDYLKCTVLYESIAEDDADNCPFVLWVGSKRRIKRKQLDEFISRSYSI